MSFGFSVGDFVAALELVGTVIRALRETGGAKSRLREVVNELYSLERAILQVKQLEFDAAEESEYQALCAVAAQCHETIDTFYRSASRYTKRLLNDGDDARAYTAWLKIKWTICHRDDIDIFRAGIAAHTQSLHLLLTTVEVKRTRASRSANIQALDALGTLWDKALRQCSDKLIVLSNAVSNSVVNGQTILRNTMTIINTNVKVYQLVCSMHGLLSQIPLQVER
jgi:hypothetical protein